MAKEKFDFIQPIKDIPKSLKGFPKNLIHIWKDPVESSEQVKERKKEIFPLLYLFVGLCLIFVVLGVVISKLESLFTTIGIIPGLAAVLCGFLLVVLKKAAEKFADIECNNCKKRIQYDENVQIKVVKKRFTIHKSDKTIEKNNVPVESTINVSGKEHVTLEITCKCQECGTEKTFTHEFVTAECEKSAVKIPYVQSGATMVLYERDVQEVGAEGFEGKDIGTLPNGVRIKYVRTPEMLVKGYFGNEIQMR